MSRDSKGILFGAILLCCFQVAMAAEDNTAIIVAGIVVGLFVIVFVVGISIFCLYRQGAFKKSEHKKKRHHRHERHINGGVHPQPVIKPYKIPYPPPEQPVFHVPYSPQKYQKHQNGFVPAPVMEPALDPRMAPPMVYPNTTYHGPPPGFEQTPPVRPGTFSGAPPVTYIKYGTMQLKADPKPVMKKSRRKDRQPIKVENGHVGHRSKSKERSRNQPQEYIIQPSYDGMPVIRPVIYLDEEEDKRKSRSKSREPRESRHRHKSRESPKPNVTEVRLETANPTSLRAPTPTLEPEPRTRSPTPPRPPRSPLVKSSRASSVTEAVNALRMSVKDHQGDGMSDTTSHSSKAPSFGWTQTDHRAPEPAAGDVMFFPAGKQVPESNQSPHVRYEKKDDVYGYAHVIKSPSQREPTQPLRQSVARTTVTNGGYHESNTLSQTGTREEPSYETEHSRVSGVYGGGIGASMSERLTSLVEDGDRSRFNHYNIGAVDLGPEEEDEVDPVQLRVRRPDTPPSDIPRDSALYADVVKPTRPPTPPSDFPLNTPRDSTEIPPLNLGSTVNSPRPDTPPQDFPITPKPSFTRDRPPTPPYDVETSRSNVGDSNPYLVPNTSRSLAQSVAADPTTGEPGSFQARQRLIEAHLKKNTPDTKASSVKFNQKTELIPRSEPNSPRFPDPLQSVAVPPPPPAPPVNITPGVIPPAPPPPPPPPPPPALFK